MGRVARGLGMATFLTGLLVVPGVGASDPGDETLTPAAVDPCAEDVIRLCPGVKPGGGRVTACLRQHEASLGQACRDKVDRENERARQFIREFGQACKGDIERVCPAIEPGGGRVIGCLGQHQLELSNGCQAVLERISAARERVEAFNRICGADVRRLCAGVPEQAGPLLECVEAREAEISPGCRAMDFRAVAAAAVTADLVEQMTRQDRVREALEIFQGLDSVAFSRSQVLFQFDSFQSVGGKANAGRMLFNPQLVLGEKGEFSLQLKVPVTALFPYAPGAPTQFGLGAVTAQAGWNFLNTGRARHFLSLGLQMATASSIPIGGPWAVIPAYAVGLGLARWISLTTQVVWIRSLYAGGSYPDVNVLYVEPIVAVNLPGRTFFALDTRLGWNFTTGTFIPLMKGAGGIFLDRQKSVSVSAWYQAALSQPSADQIYKYEVGAGMAYFFDW